MMTMMMLLLLNSIIVDVVSLVMLLSMILLVHCKHAITSGYSLITYPLSKVCFSQLKQLFPYTLYSNACPYLCLVHARTVVTNLLQCADNK